MKFIQLTSILLLAAASVHGQVDHSGWDKLLHEHVDSNGWVSYRNFESDSTLLNDYLTALSNNPPTDSWSQNEKLAYWINAYNAFTVKLILNHYPVKSIKDIKRGIPFINSVWDIEFFEIGGEKMDLNQIEHSVLRKQFDEPRIHFAIVCASKSCPQLLNQAYFPDTVEEQLEKQAKKFINDSSKNVIKYEKLSLSSIFRWFKGDFTKGQSLKAFIRNYTDTAFSSNATVTYMDYDWTLNGE